MIDINIVLIGFMGSGKTTVGKALSNKNNFSFIDTDDLITKEEKKQIPEIFNEYGEEYFRELETNVLKELSSNASNNIILSTGGGMVMREKNVKLMNKIGVIIYLKTTPEVILKRLQNDNSRPLLKDKSKENIIKLFNKREKYYQASGDIIINTNNKSIDKIVKEIEGCI
ncbi:MAG: shikimate kinase [Halanaerobiales bacterium]